MSAAASLRGWIGRIALAGIGLVFIVAGGLKALDAAGFVEQIARYRFVPAAAAPVIAWLLVPLEVILGAALLLDWRRRIAVTAAVILLAGFLGLMTYTWATGGDVSECGCFGNFVKRTPAETILEDLIFIAIALLGLLAPARRADRGAWRGALAGATGAATVALMAIAPGLPLDGLVTGLKPGRTLEELHLSVPDAAFGDGRHLVALLALDQEESGRAADALNALAAQPGAPAVAALYADEEEVKDAFFWSHYPTFPMYRVIHEEMRGLYRRLPRFFLLENGVVVKVWEDVPPAAAFVGGDPIQEASR